MCGLVHLEENPGRKNLEIGPAGKKRKRNLTVYKSDDGVDEPEHMTADRVSREGGAKGACGIDAQNGYRLWFARVADTVCLGRSRRLGWWGTRFQREHCLLIKRGAYTYGDARRTEGGRCT
jgi:hypothetical protein